MSIPVLAQVYDEMRRLAIAGSVVAAGDFRLKKLVAPLEQAGAKAPVFAKVADAVKAVVDGKEQASAEALLELVTLVNAILYTQGETGAAGALEPIETNDLGLPSTQASARTLKPLLEALTSTGSGRLELIRDAHERNAFRDIRLVKPALDALDDGYGEIADFIAEKVLPIYGKAILPEIRTTLDLKGKAGNPRRLRLLHGLDPVGSRETVKRALDEGSKEVRVVAIECLGSAPEDLSYLIEQAGAKSQEVRQAAYRALSGIDDDAAAAVLEKALAGKDLDIAAASVRHSRNSRLLKFVLAGARKEVTALGKAKDKKEISQKVNRLASLLSCFQGREDKDTEAFLLELLGQREELAQRKGDTSSGSDLNEEIVELMAEGSTTMKKAVVQIHASLETDELPAAFAAARRVLTAAEVYDNFSPYLTAELDAKKNKNDPATAKRDLLCRVIGGIHHTSFGRRNEEAPPLDPRWLDIAIRLKDLGMIRQLSRPGHAATNAFLKEMFDDTLKSAKTLEDCHQIVAAMVHAAHPEATGAFITVYEKYSKKVTNSYQIHWFNFLIRDLPRSAIPALEALVTRVDEKIADGLLDGIQRLRDKK